MNDKLVVLAMVSTSVCAAASMTAIGLFTNGENKKAYPITGLAITAAVLPLTLIVKCRKLDLEEYERETADNTEDSAV